MASSLISFTLAGHVGVDLKPRRQKQRRENKTSLGYRAGPRLSKPEQNGTARNNRKPTKTKGMNMVCSAVFSFDINCHRRNREGKKESRGHTSPALFVGLLSNSLDWKYHFSSVLVCFPYTKKCLGFCFIIPSMISLEHSLINEYRGFLFFLPNVYQRQFLSITSVSRTSFP